MRYILGIFKLMLGLIMTIGIIGGMLPRLKLIEDSSDLVGIILGLLLGLLYVYSLINNGIVEIKGKVYRKDVFRISEIVIHFIFALVIIIGGLVSNNIISMKLIMISVGLLLLFVAIRDIRLLRKMKEG